MSRDVDDAGARRASRRSQLWVLVVCMAISALLGVVASRSYLTWHNTLANNGNWDSTKTTLERGVLAAFSFVNERQTLAGGVLRLSAWHGHNEVTHRRDLDRPVRLEFDVRMEPGAYIAALFNRAPRELPGGEQQVGEPKGGERQSSVRLSGRKYLDSSLVTASEDGEFLSYEKIPGDPLAADVWHRVRLEFGEDSLEVFVDGESRGVFGHRFRPRQGFGFRCGFRAVEVDNVVVTQADGRRVTETFDMPGGSARITAAVVIGLLLANVLLLLLLRKATRAEGMELSFYFLMVNATLLVIGVLLFVFVLMRADRYIFSDDRLAEEEAYFLKGASDRVVAEARDKHPMEGEEGVYRILFIGGSQTWGAGAQVDEDVVVPVVESMLNEAATGVRFECINGGISASKVRDQLPLLRKVWLRFQPDLVVFNVGSNDKSTKNFARVLSRMVAMSRAEGAGVLLVQEANNTEKWLNHLPDRHRDMQAVAAELEVPLLDMHGYLESWQHAGFLWWDFVHLTSFGQRLMAERFSEEILQLVRSDSGIEPEEVDGP